MSKQPKLVKSIIRPRNQITLPPEIIAALGTEVGDAVQFTLGRDGIVRLHPLRLYLLVPEPEPAPVVDQLEDAAYGEYVSAGPQW